jgi:hypothetical protein
MTTAFWPTQLASLAATTAHTAATPTQTFAQSAENESANAGWKQRK